LAEPYLIVLHPQVVSYDAELGLVLGQAGHWCSRPTGRPAQEHRYAYRRETYQHHVDQVVKVCRDQGPSYCVATERLAQQLGIPAEAAEKLAWLAASLHDVGKLSAAWQDAIWDWQLVKSPGQRQGFLAHSDYDPVTDRVREEARAFTRPPHAAEGAFAVANVILRYLEESLGISDEQLQYGIARCVWTAIARHHGARTSSVNSFRFAQGAVVELSAFHSKLLQFLHAQKLYLSLEVADWLDSPSELDRADFEKRWVEASNEAIQPFLPLYWYLARRLRLADQHSHEWKED